MHSCPECGQACACDGEDTWFENYLSCEHYCDPDAEYDSDDDHQADGMAIGFEGVSEVGWHCRWCGEPLILGRCADCDAGKDNPQRA